MPPDPTELGSADGVKVSPLRKRPPTDFELLRDIHLHHRDDFESALARSQRSAVILVPIDIPAVAKRLGTDPHAVFGRLYYHLEPKYAPAPEPGAERVDGRCSSRRRPAPMRTA
jgi:hypothetical protein